MGLVPARARIHGASARARLFTTLASGERGLLVGAAIVVVVGADLVLPAGLPSHAAADPLEALPAAEREAMAWIAEQTPAASKFLVLSPKTSWEVDYDNCEMVHTSTVRGYARVPISTR